MKGIMLNQTSWSSVHLCYLELQAKIVWCDIHKTQEEIHAHVVKHKSRNIFVCTYYILGNSF